MLAAAMIGLLQRRGFLAAAADATADAARAAIAAYQRWHGLLVTGEPDAPTVRSLAAQRMCGLPDAMEQTAEAAMAAKWPTLDLSWFVTNPGAFPGLDAQRVVDAFAWAWGQWASVCAIRPRQAANAASANVVISCAPIDGAMGVLAWSELADGTARAKSQRYDSQERWAAQSGPTPPANLIDLMRVACHETGHVLGIPHIAGGNLLQPTYDSRIWSPQAGDIREAQARYGPPVAVAPPPTPPAHPVGGIPWTITISGTGEIDGVSIPNFRVTKIQG